jgi:hypothetical protein
VIDAVVGQVVVYGGDIAAILDIVDPSADDGFIGFGVGVSIVHGLVGLQ